MKQFPARLDFVLCSSAKADKRIQGIKKELDKRTCGYKRRLEAMTKSTDHLETMIKWVLRLGKRADHLLMDSWLCLPGLHAMEKIRSAGIVAEDVALTFVDTVMIISIDMFQTG